MAIELYYFQPLGSNSGRVYLALLEKGLDFVGHELSGRRFEHLAPAYLAVNPKGQVPTLVHDGIAITEGGPANEYIDEAFDGPPLRPHDPRLRWEMRRWCKRIDIDWGRALMMIHWNRVVPMFQGANSREEFERSSTGFRTLIAADPGGAHSCRIFRGSKSRSRTGGSA